MRVERILNKSAQQRRVWAWFPSRKRVSRRRVANRWRRFVFVQELRKIVLFFSEVSRKSNLDNKPSVFEKISVTQTWNLPPNFPVLQT